MTDPQQANDSGQNFSSPPIQGAERPIRVLGPSAELHAVLEEILQQLQRQLDYDACALLLLENGELQFTACQGMLELPDEASEWFDPGALQQLDRLLIAGEPVVAPDLREDRLFFGELLFAEMRSCVIAPLVYRERSIGLLAVLNRAPHFYAQQEAESAMTFALQAAMAIENTRLYTKTRRHAQQLEAANLLGQRVAAILDPDILLPEVVRLIHENLGYYHVHLFLVDGASKEIVLQECSGHAHESLKAEGLRIKIGGQGITSWAAQTGQPVLSNDVLKEERFRPHELLSETRSELAIPLRIGEVVLGVLDVQSREYDGFQDADVTTLQILADQIAVAIENAHLFEETRRQYQTMRVLHDLSLDITSQLETDGVVTAILAKSAELMETEGATLWLYEPDAESVRQIAYYNVKPAYDNPRLHLGDGIAGKVVKSRKSLFINDYKNWDGRSPLFQDSASDAVLCVPLRWQGQVIGALCVLDRGDHRPFAEDDAARLSLLADVASIALTNAELHTTMMDFSQQLKQTVERRTIALAEAREALARKARQLQKLHQSTVRVQEEERSRIAMDLHDGSNQLITGTLFEIQAAQKSIQDQHTEIALDKLEAAKTSLRQVEAENRRIINNLRPPILDAKGLVPALKWHVKEMWELSNVRHEFRISGEPRRLFPEVETAIFRIVQESLNNVKSHANAHAVQVHLQFRPSHLRLIIDDDGIGFDELSVLDDSVGRMGLIGIRERALSIGGTLEVDSELGAGSRIFVEVPLPDEGHNGEKIS